MSWPFGGGRWFPGTNLQDLNLDWIIRRVRDLSKGIIAPWINPQNYNWMVYDVEQDEFVDSGVSAAGEGVGPPGPQGPAGPQGPSGELPKRKWIFIGDSYAHASGTNQGWVDKLVPMLGLTISDYYEASLGGASFTGGSTTDINYQFKTLLVTLDSVIVDKTAITDIVVLGGANEIGVSADAISSAIDDFNNYVNSYYPNAVIRIGFIGGNGDYTKTGIQYSRAKEGYANCGKAQYLNNLEFVFQNRNLIDAGGVHPTAQGYTILSAKIFEALQGGCNIIYRDQGAPAAQVGFSPVTGTAGYNVFVCNNLTNISLFGRPGQITTDQTKYFAVANGANIPVTTIPSKLFLAGSLGSYNPLISSTVIATVRSTINNTRYQVKGFCFITGANNVLYFIPNDSVIGTTSAFNSCDLIEIDAVTFAAASIAC